MYELKPVYLCIVEQRHKNLSPTGKRSGSSLHVPKHVRASTSSDLEHSPSKAKTPYSPNKHKASPVHKTIPVSPSKTPKSALKHTETKKVIHPVNNVAKEHPPKRPQTSPALREAMQQLTKANGPVVRVERMPSPVQTKIEHVPLSQQKPILASNGAPGPGIQSTVQITAAVVSSQPQMVTNTVVTKVFKVVEFSFYSNLYCLQPKNYEILVYFRWCQGK